MSNDYVYIPMELLVDILVKLPVKSLQRFKLVCKSWYVLIKSPEFIYLHLSYASSTEDNHRMIVKHCVQQSSSYQIHVSFLSDIAIESEEFDFSLEVPVPIALFDDVDDEQLGYGKFKGKDYVTFYGPCNGIICALGDRQGDLISLWNPATRDIKRLPRPPLAEILSLRPNLFVSRITVEIGFGFDSNSNEYKVVRILDINGVHCDVHVYNLSTNSWRKIDASVPTKGRFRGCNSVYLDGVYYWCSGSFHRPFSILTFDFAHEVFDVIHTSPAMARNDIFTVVKYKEALAILSIDQDIRNYNCLWALDRDSNNNSIWCKLFIVHFHYADAILGFGRNGRAVIRNGARYDGRIPDCRIGTYDPVSKQLKSMGPYNSMYNGYHVQVFNYVESLVTLNI